MEVVYLLVISLSNTLKLISVIRNQIQRMYREVFRYMVYDRVDAYDTSYMPMVESPLDEVNELPAINFEQATVTFFVDCD